MKLGTIVIFLGYQKLMAGEHPVFRPGDLLVVFAVDDEGIYRCGALGVNYLNASRRTDLIFAEELAPLSQALADRGRLPADRSMTGQRISSRQGSSDGGYPKERTAYSDIGRTYCIDLRTFFLRAFTMIRRMHRQRVQGRYT